MDRMTHYKRGDTIKELEGDPKNRKNGVKQPLLTAYKDTRGIWTIGYGHTGTDVKEGTKITEAQANELLKSDSKIAADCVRRIFQQPWRAYQKKESQRGG